tara:strand:- start:454 stop:1953 length:1500 start_codon:yes stop_codon:yes gene_type:complete
MKQLKVVVNDNPSNLLTQAGGYVTANFINPVEVKKGSLICLDKFNATSKNITQNFGLVAETIGIGVNVIDLETPLAFTQVIIPAGTYNTIAEYIAAVNQAVNAVAISAYRPLSPGVYSPNNWANVQSQNGMRVYLQLVDGLFARWTSQCYGSSPLSTTPSTFWTPSANIAIDVDGFHYSTDTLEGTITSAQVTVGGGVSTSAIIRPSITSTAVWTYGFVTAGALGGKILQKAGSVNLWVQNDAGVQTEIPNSQALFPGAYAGSLNSRFMLYQSNGVFRFAYYNDITDAGGVWFTSEPGNYDMGNWYYSSDYVVVQTVVGNVAPFGATNYTPEQFQTTFTLPFPSIPNTIVNLTAASQFALVFGYLVADNLVFTTNDANTFQALLRGTRPANVLQLRSAFELGIEIIDLPLKTYFAKSGSSGFGGRQNVVCYFTPTLAIDAEGLYSFANSVHQWLDIDNSADTTLHSLSFRIFNPYTGASFVSNSMGFNLLIKSPDELEN